MDGTEACPFHLRFRCTFGEVPNERNCDWNGLLTEYTEALPRLGPDDFHPIFGVKTVRFCLFHSGKCGERPHEALQQGLASLFRCINDQNDLTATQIPNNWQTTGKQRLSTLPILHVRPKLHEERPSLIISSAKQPLSVPQWENLLPITTWMISTHTRKHKEIAYHLETTC